MAGCSAPVERIGDDIKLADLHIGASKVVLASAQSTAFGGLQPIVEGHRIVAPRRCARRVSELSEEEWLDLWRTVARTQASPVLLAGMLR